MSKHSANLSSRRVTRNRTVVLVALAALGLLALRALVPTRQRPIPPGFISCVPTGEPWLLAFEVVGTIDKGAIRAMADQVLAAFETEGEVDLLVLMDRFEGMTAGAATDPRNLLSQARSLTHVRKYGVVGAPAMAAAMIEVFDKLIPVDARTFAAHEVDDAWVWIRAPEPDGAAITV